MKLLIVRNDFLDKIRPIYFYLKYWPVEFLIELIYNIIFQSTQISKMTKIIKLFIVGITLIVLSGLTYLIVVEMIHDLIHIFNLV